MHIVKLVLYGRRSAGRKALVLRHHPGGKFRVFNLIVNRGTPGFGVKNFSYVDTLLLLLTDSEHPRPEPTSTIMSTCPADLQQHSRLSLLRIRRMQTGIPKCLEIL